jgi:Ribulose 1,5-bisphosphate carboxylase, large subunit
MDIDLPASFGEHYTGPAFGIDGCRKLTGVNDRPLIGTIIKPSIGLSVQQTADIVKTLAEAGIDFIKDWIPFRSIECPTIDGSAPKRWLHTP